MNTFVLTIVFFFSLLVSGITLFLCINNSKEESGIGYDGLFWLSLASILWSTFYYFTHI